MYDIDLALTWVQANTIYGWPCTEIIGFLSLNNLKSVSYILTLKNPYTKARTY